MPRKSRLTYHSHVIEQRTLALAPCYLKLNLISECTVNTLHTVLYCTALYCTLLHCTALYCTVQ